MPVRVQKKLMKQTWYPQPHDIQGSCSFELDDATLDSTIIPLAFYDEGMGNPELRETNPRNAAFAVVADEANCFVGSRVNNIESQFRFSMTSLALDDNMPSIRFATMPIYMAFLEDYTAIDELSSIETRDVLEMQVETTDRQGGPLYVAGTDLPEKFTGGANLGANTPFLDTDIGLEAVAFSTNAWYDAIHFLTIGPKLLKLAGPLKWHTLTQNRPFKNLRFNITPKVKRMNEFTYCGVLVHVPIGGHPDQTSALADFTAATNKIHLDWFIRYNEWNEDFNSRMI